MSKFPSITAAIVTGAVIMPLFVLGCDFINTSLQSQSLLLLWTLVGFFAPVLFATADMKYVASRWREVGGFFRPLATRQDFRLFYIPAWTRFFVLFATSVVSMLILKLLGVDF